MAEDARDVLMKIILEKTAIPAECSTVIDANDPLASDFTSASSGNGWKGNYFAVDDFQMEIGLMGDSNPGNNTVTRDQMAEMQKANQEALKLLAEAQQNDEERRKMPTVRSANEFGRFMTNGRSAMRGRSYSANLEPVTLTKRMDASSLTLFKACINSTTLDSAVLIKRRAGGGDSLQSYLRIEFTDLLITDFNWDEDDVIKEKIKFVCRKAEVQYSIQSAAGTQQKAAMSRSWSVLNLSS
jgi:type VI protein secretion system component Hcp